MERRKFLSLLGTAAAGAALAKPAQAAGVSHFEGYPNSSGVLFDATRCIGCRRCEAGCNQVNGLPAPPEPFDDLSVLDRKRRTHAWTYTVVNRYDNIPGSLRDRCTARTSASIAWSRPAPPPALSGPLIKLPRGP